MIRIFIFYLSCCCCITNIAAQEEKQIIVDTSLSEINLNDITISATRFATLKKNIPQEIISISSKKIAWYNQQTSAELLTQTGSVLVQKSQLGGGSPLIRGFEANKVLLVVDGVRMNNAIYRGGHLQNIITMDNAVLDKVEILLGPSSVLYGSDALGGVIAFYTKKPQLSATAGKVMFSGNAFTRFASAYNEQTLHADLSIGTKKIALLTSFTFSDFGDLRQGGSYRKQYGNWGKRTFYVSRIDGVDSMVANSNPNLQVKTGYRQYDLLQKLLFKTGRLEHVLNFQYSTSSNINRYDRLTETNGAGVARSAEWYYGPQKRLMVSWSVALPAASIYDAAQITTAYQRVEESRHNRNYRSVRLNHRKEQLDIVTLNADFTKKVDKLHFGYGAELTYNKVNSSAYAENINTGESSSLDTRYPDGGSTTRSFAAYLTGRYPVSGKIILNAGLRYTLNTLHSRFTDKTFFPLPYDEIRQSPNAFTGNIGLVVLPSKGWKLSALIGTGFRTPNVDDLAKVFEPATGTVIVPNAGIKPEYTINYELNAVKNIRNRLTISASLWYTDYRNALSTDFALFNGFDSILYDGNRSRVVTIVNKKSAWVWGWSANVAAVLNSHITFTSSINYTFGRIREEPANYPLDHIAPLFGKSGVQARFGKFTAELFALYNGPKSSANYNLRGEDNQVYSADPINGYTPSWITANCRTSWQLNRYATIQIAAENLFDTFYRVFASGLSAPGRNIVVTLRAKL